MTEALWDEITENNTSKSHAFRDNVAMIHELDSVRLVMDKERLVLSLRVLLRHHLPDNALGRGISCMVLELQPCRKRQVGNVGVLYF